jgi:2-polyprenyl-3-methyl-5-hydroxy-6-metoxy-1,4-benzoquinol methylase
MSSYKDLDVNYSKHLPQNKESKILDFGCGTGRVLKYLQEKGFTNLSGADIDNTGWTELNEQNINTTKITDTKEYLMSIKNTYDFIVAKDVIYYFDSKEIVDIVTLLKNALKPEGKILFEIFNGATLTGPYVKYKDIGIQLILTEHSLKSIIQNAGMTVYYIGGNKMLFSGFRSTVFNMFHFLEKIVLRLLYFSERGIDEQNPTIYTRKVIAIAKKD